MRRHKTKLQSYQQAIQMASVMNPIPSNIVKNVEVNHKSRWCYRCDSGYGYMMKAIVSNVQPYVFGFVCPNCNFTIRHNQRTKGIRTV